MIGDPPNLIIAVSRGVKFMHVYKPIVAWFYSSFRP
jgi:Na+/H+ antiporter NhaD/arsenite permease-like protein